MRSAIGRPRSSAVGGGPTVHHPVAAKRQSLARRALFGELMPMLSGEGVDDLLIESRGVQDGEDRQTLVDLIHTRVSG
jgi:hypothetical protein